MTDTETSAPEGRPTVAERLREVAANIGLVTYRTDQETVLVAAALLDQAKEALEPFARLKVSPPYMRKARGNAGAYSLRFDHIEHAQAALAALNGTPAPKSEGGRE